nr:membrane protein insertion efficiency factor YidD [Homoserinimonas aerilata]
MRSFGTGLLLLPRNVSIAVLQTYRKLVSPLYGDVCRYYPSCSSYALGAIQQHGVFKGIWLGSLRILRCNPWSAGGVDDVPENKRHSHHTNRFGFVTSCEAAHSARDANISSTPESKHHRKV